MKKITAKSIRKLNPCDSAIKKFEKDYPKFNGKLSKLLTLEKIRYENKIWLASRIVPVKLLQIWSVMCAEYVLPNFEKEFPSDSRVREALETAKKVINGELDNSAASAAWSAASAACAAESAACAAESAACAAESAAWSAAGETHQENVNLSLLISILENNNL